MAEATEETAGGGKGSSMKIMLLMIIGAVIVIGASMGGTFFMLKTSGLLDQQGSEHQAAPVAEDVAALPPIYHALDPAFVVNFKEKGRSRFLQVTMEVMTRDDEVIAAMDVHAPVIRNNVLLLLSAQESAVLRSPEGKEKVREMTLAALNKILTEHGGFPEVKEKQTPPVEAVYFTSFVIQ